MEPALHNHNNFSLLRHLAAAFVLYAHALASKGEPEPLNQITAGRLELSSLGVEIFFIISGYLVTKSMLQSTSRLQFAGKRFLRLWPALFLVTSLLVFVAGPIYTDLPLPAYFSSGKTWYFYLRNCLFVPVFKLPGVFGGHPVNGTFWTLLFEVACYMVILIVGRRLLENRRRPLAMAWLAMVIFKFLILPNVMLSASIEQYRYGVSHLMFLFFTASAWFLNRRARIRRIGIILFIALGVFVLSILFPFRGGFGLLRDIALMIIITEWGRSKEVFRWPGWDISYGTYLLSFAIQTILMQTILQDASALSVFLATLSVTVPLAFGCWYLVEKPALRLKKML